MFAVDVQARRLTRAYDICSYMRQVFADEVTLSIMYCPRCLSCNCSVMEKKAEKSIFGEKNVCPRRVSTEDMHSFTE